MDKAVESGEVIDEEMLETVNKLHTLLRPFILRRLKSEVETQLPGKFEHVVYCKLSKRQRFLYDEFMARASTKEALSSGGYLGVVNTLMQLRKVCNHPDLFEVRPVRTSFAMDPVVVDYEPVELLVRKRLLQVQDDKLGLDALNLDITGHEDKSGWACETRHRLDASDRLPYAIEPVITTATTTKKGKQTLSLPLHPPLDTLTIEGWLKYRAWHEEQKSIARWRSLRDNNRHRCAVKPIFGSTFLSMLTDIPNVLHPLNLPTTRPHMFGEHAPPASSLVSSLAERSRVLEPLVNYYAVIPPNVVARGLATYALPGLTPLSHPSLTNPDFDTLHQSTVKLQIAFPDSSLLQYDCGKLQTLYTMLRDLKANGHRVLIFTQMTRVLDILEMFLSYNGHRYLRLDGSTKIEDRQIITERFNSDSRIFCFIASSRSGGVGINLTGADTVFFYDSDWNPSMDRQCMDRAHRIGQTREVHIYRFVSTHTVEENMLKKANQKRMLDRVVIQQGEFTTDFFGKMDWRDVIDPVSEGQALAKARDGDQDETLDPDAMELDGDEAKIEDIEVDDEPTAVKADSIRPRAGDERELARALAEVEDEEDAAAARIALGEGEMDIAEFDATEGQGQGPGQGKKVVPKRVGFERNLEESGTPATPMDVDAGEDARDEEGDGDEEEEEDDGIGSVDEYMLKLVEWDWAFFATYRA
jgi:helicase SWR1